MSVMKTAVQVNDATSRKYISSRYIQSGAAKSISIFTRVCQSLPADGLVYSCDHQVLALIGQH